jgi:RNA polymerase sigma-70 factor (ECF subfamily)
MLPPLDRALMLLHLDDHDHRQIADILGISTANVSTRLHRLRQQLRARFDPTA